MVWVWLGITLAVGLGVLNFYLWYVDHQVVKQRFGELEETIRKLLDLIRQWEGWGRLVCVITADAKLAIPDPPPSIDGDGTKVRV